MDLSNFSPTEFSLDKEDAPSGVNKQPSSDQETAQGAMNRVKFIQRQHPSAAFWVGIEGGIQFDEQNQMCAFAWIVIKNAEFTGKARSGTFFLPPELQIW